MPEYTGKDLKVFWIHSGGTADLSCDYRTLNYQPTIGQVEVTSACDTFNEYLMTTKDTTVTLTAVTQTGGTVIEAALVEGTFGTLIVAPEGTAAGKRKYTIPAFSMGANTNYGFRDAVEFSVTFQGSGTRANGTY